MSLLDEFPLQFGLLRHLFPDDHFTTDRIRRLDEIFRTAEERWEENVRRRLSGVGVRYLLIGEAPPWSGSGTVRYFYNITEGAWLNRNGSWVKAVLRTFFPNGIPSNPEDALNQIAEMGFLLVDSLPFPEAYKSAKRKTTIYKHLIKSCCGYFLDKLQNSHIGWSEHVRAALAFKLNGQAVVESLPDGILLPTGQRLILSNECICADRSGYTNTEKLRSMFGING